MKKSNTLETKAKPKKKLAEQVQMLFEKRGRKAFEIAKEAILNEKLTYKPVREALKYFMEQSWYGLQHPALMSVACEAVEGDPNETTSIGAAMVLLAGAMDIHDDIIDQSQTKGSKPTVLGKFGRDIALLVGDALIFKGLMLLHEACEKFPPKKKKGIMTLMTEAIFELGNAEANETNFVGRYDVAPEEYLNTIRMKASITDAYARIGAIIGDGDSKQIEVLGDFGRTLGILTTLREDFIDIFEPEELRNRFRNECLPLPLLLAFKNKETRKKILSKLENKTMTKREAYVIVKLIWDMKQIQNLRREMHIMVERTLQSIGFVRQTNLLEDLKLMLYATVEDLK